MENNSKRGRNDTGLLETSKNIFKIRLKRCPENARWDGGILSHKIRQNQPKYGPALSFSVGVTGSQISITSSS